MSCRNFDFAHEEGEQVRIQSTFAVSMLWLSCFALTISGSAFASLALAPQSQARVPFQLPQLAGAPAARSYTHAIAQSLVPNDAQSLADALVEREPVPDKPAQNKALEELKRAFSDKFPATGRDAQRSLARMLLNQPGLDNFSAPEAYVSFDQALNLAISALDIACAMDAITGMGLRFDIDDNAKKCQAIADITPKVLDEELGDAVVAVEAYLDERIRNEDWMSADNVLNRSRTLARRLGNQWDAKRDAYVNSVASLKKVEACRATLKTKPNDKEANAIVGVYYLERGAFAQAVPMISLGTESELRDIARRDQDESTGVGDHKAIAETWFAWARKQKGPLRLRGLERSRYWFSQCDLTPNSISASGLSGRIAQIDVLLSDPESGTAPQTPTKPTPKQIVRAIPAGAARTCDVFGGKWSEAKGEIIQESLSPETMMLAFGDKSWSDYDIAVEAMSEEGEGSIGILFHLQSREVLGSFGIGKYGKTFAEVARWKNGATTTKEAMPRPLTLGTWYALRMEVRGSQVRCFCDNELFFDSADDSITSGRAGFCCWGTKVRFRNLSVKSADGRALWTGMPQIK
jgi:hypothetical protein